MDTLINSSLCRILKNKLFWIGFAILILCYLIYYGYIYHGISYEIYHGISYNKAVFNGGILVIGTVLILLIVIPFCVLEDVRYGIIRNMIMAGKSRKEIFFSKNILSVIVVFIYVLLQFLISALYLSLYNPSYNMINYYFKKIFLSLVIIITFSVVYTSFLLMAKKVMRGMIMFSALFFTVPMMALFIMQRNNYILRYQELLKYQEQKGEYDYNKIIELRKTYIYMAQKRLEIGNLTEEEKDKERKLINENSDYIKMNHGYMVDKDGYYTRNYSSIGLKLSEIYDDLFFINTIVALVSEDNRTTELTIDHNIDYLKYMYYYKNYFDVCNADKEYSLTNSEYYCLENNDKKLADNAESFDDFVKKEEELLKDEGYKALSDKAKELIENGYTFGDEYNSYEYYDIVNNVYKMYNVKKMVLIAILWNTLFLGLGYMYFSKREIR